MAIRDCRGQYNEETKIHPRPTELHCSRKYGRAERYCLLDNGMVTHRVDG